jgi:hypothetical protein
VRGSRVRWYSRKSRFSSCPAPTMSRPITSSSMARNRWARRRGSVFDDEAGARAPHRDVPPVAQRTLSAPARARAARGWRADARARVCPLSAMVVDAERSPRCRWRPDGATCAGECTACAKAASLTSSGRHLSAMSPSGPTGLFRGTGAEPWLSVLATRQTRPRRECCGSSSPGGFRARRCGPARRVRRRGRRPRRRSRGRHRGRS